MARKEYRTTFLAMEAILQLPRALHTVVEDRKIVVIGKGLGLQYRCYIY